MEREGKTEGKPGNKPKKPTTRLQTTDLPTMDEFSVPPAPGLKLETYYGGMWPGAQEFREEE